METVETEKGYKTALKKARKLILVGLTFIAGLLLTLTGLNLIQLSPPLILYSGLALLMASVLFYFLS